MTAYERFSSFYDAVMDDPGPRAEQVTTWIDRYLPHASSMLELGCGTGSILARMPSVLSLTGLDRSPEMLAVARDKVPGARLVEADMTYFSLEDIFDVNTLGELRRLGEEPPWVYDFDQGVAIIDVAFAEDGMSDGLSLWDIRIFEHAGEDGYTLHREQIGELAVPLSLIKSTLEGDFLLLEESNENGHLPTDDSVKGHFCYRRVGPGPR
jgi:SAM-dependent methyltransferase